MSRLAKLQKASLVAALVVSYPLGALAAESLDELRARGRAATEPDQAIAVAKDLRRAGLVGDALTTLQRAFAKARGDMPVASLRIELARTYLDKREPKKAVRECAQIHKLSPFLEHLCNAEAQLYTRRGSVALPEAEEALALQPDSYEAVVAKGRAQSQLGKPGDADASFRKAMTMAPSRPEARRYLAELLLASNETAAAIATLREAKNVAPDDPETLVLLGETLPENAEARDVLGRAITIRPSFARAKARLGRVLTVLGDYERAQKALSEAVAAEPRQADWHAMLGEAYVANKKPDQALKSAQTTLGIVGNHGPAKLVEARALAQKGEIDLAITAFEAAYGFLRQDPRALVAAARACVDGGRLTTAKAFADRATEDFPKVAESWEVLGDVSVAAKDKAGAKKAYDRALQTEGAAKDRIRGKLAALK
jgi:tetratricopeptide (TPR) repeat protein